MRITVKNHRRNQRNSTSCCSARLSCFAGIIVGRDAVCAKQFFIRLLGFLECVTYGYILVALDVDHGELLHQARAVLQGHEVGRLVRHVDQQREGCFILKILNLALC